MTDENLKSPFPGMDPYLEDRWPEVHARLIVYACNQINQQLPVELQANIEENLIVRYEQEDIRDRTIRPDLNISGRPKDPSVATVLSPAIPVATPTLLRTAPHPQRHVAIVDPSGRVITAIEFLSPWNKVGARARERYTRKQSDYQAAGINLVEIDLVRQGRYVMLAPLEDIPKSTRLGYMICVYRDIIPDQIELYAAPLQMPLPNIPVPLRPTDPDAVLQLQPLIDTCYQDGRYYRINYQLEPRAKFDGPLQSWIQSHLQERGRRT